MRLNLLVILLVSLQSIYAIDDSDSLFIEQDSTIVKDSTLIHLRLSLDSTSTQIVQIENSIINLQQQIQKVKEFGQESLEASKNNFNNSLKETKQSISKLEKSINNKFNKVYELLKIKYDSLDQSNIQLKSELDSLDSEKDAKIGSLKKDINWKFIFIISIVLLILSIIIPAVYLFKKKLGEVNYLEESINQNIQISQMLENQMTLMKKSQIEQTLGSDKKITDHRMGIQTGYEIFRMKKYLLNLGDSEINEVQKLKRAIDRLADEYESNGYEITDLTDQDYQIEMNVKVINEIENPELEKGKKIISRVIKPQISFDDQVISHAEVEVMCSDKE